MRGINSPYKGIGQYGISPDVCEAGFIMTQEEWFKIKQDVDEPEPEDLLLAIKDMFLRFIKGE